MKFISQGLCLLLGMGCAANVVSRTGQVFKINEDKSEIKIYAVSGQYDIELVPQTIFRKYREISKDQALTDGTFVRVNGKFDKRFDKHGMPGYLIKEWLTLFEDSNIQDIKTKRFLQGRITIENGIPILNVLGKRYFVDSRYVKKYFKLDIADKDDLKIREMLWVMGNISGNKITATSITIKYNEFAVNEDPSLPRVLLIGDSISMKYTSFVREELKGKANIIRIPGNGGATKRMLSQYKWWLGPYVENGFKWDVIHFNFGLHDLRVHKNENFTALKEYKENLEKIIGLLRTTNAQLIWASTTPVPENANKGSSWGEPNNADVIKYNAVAQEVMQQNNISINDLYNTILPVFHKYLLSPTNIHYNEGGSKILAKKIASEILQELNRK